MGQKKDGSGVSYTTVGFYAAELVAIEQVMSTLNLKLGAAVRLMVRAAAGEEHAQRLLAGIFPDPDAPFTAEGD